MHFELIFTFIIIIIIKRYKLVIKYIINKDTQNLTILKYINKKPNSTDNEA